MRAASAINVREIAFDGRNVPLRAKLVRGIELRVAVPKNDTHSAILEAMNTYSRVDGGLRYSRT